MNAPLPSDVLRALQTVTLDDKYTLPEGRACKRWCGFPCCSASAMPWPA